MELLFVTVIAAGIGGLLIPITRRDDSLGYLLLPALSASVTAAVWVALVWAGLTFDGGWIWVISLVLGGAAALVAALVLPRRRAVADERLLHELGL